MTPMTKTTMIAALTLAVLMAEASAQSRTHNDASGKSIGRSTTDSRGTTTIYDANGRNVGSVTTTRPQSR
jgi:ABC-type Fe3+-citrate transport system substrate-binding protein